MTDLISRDALFSAVAKLKAELAKVKAERDAAVADLQENNKCHICKHKKSNIQDCPYYSSCGLAYIHWEWRGAKNDVKRCKYE